MMLKLYTCIIFVLLFINCESDKSYSSKQVTKQEILEGDVYETVLYLSNEDVVWELECILASKDTFIVVFSDSTRTDTLGKYFYPFTGQGK